MSQNSYRLLIVDDELPAVQVIKCMIDWKSLNVTSVFTAFDIAQAKEAFTNHEIDILLCDIEMPQGSGLELLDWVRENKHSTQCIFLTCHSDFYYIKKAIQLGSLDYILKPVQPDELENAVVKAIALIDDQRTKQAQQKSGLLWDRFQPVVAENFWRDVLTQKIPARRDELQWSARQINLPLDPEEIIVPILIKIRHWHEDMSPRDAKLMEFALKNTAEDLLLKKDGQGILIEFGDEALVCLIFIARLELLNPRQTESDLNSYISFARQYFSCDICCYPGYAVQIDNLASEVAVLVDRDRDNLTMENVIVHPDNKFTGQPTVKLPDINLWLKMLDERSALNMADAMEKYLRGLADGQGNVDTAVLHYFRQDFVQILHTFLMKNGIHAHAMIIDKESGRLHNESIKSVDKMVEWIRHDAVRMIRLADSYGKADSMVGSAQRYIRANLDQNLTCEEIARHVYLHPDHLSRLFKKETSQTISEFIAGERLNLAKDLLTMSDLPVTEVALQAGYGSLSYFSTLFRKQTGLNPQEYRKSAASRGGRPV